MGDCPYTVGASRELRISAHVIEQAQQPIGPDPLAWKPGEHDPVIEAVRADLRRRSEFGLQKYGTPLARRDLKLRDWLQHAYEETLDQANYLKRAIMEIDNAADAKSD